MGHAHGSSSTTKVVQKALPRPIASRLEGGIPKVKIKLTKAIVGKILNQRIQAREDTETSSDNL
jgi:hypothetical protein